MYFMLCHIWFWAESWKAYWLFHGFKLAHLSAQVRNVYGKLRCMKPRCKSILTTCTSWTRKIRTVRSKMLRNVHGLPVKVSEEDNVFDLSLYDSLGNSVDFFSCSQPQHTKFASCMWQMQGSTLTDGQLLHSCHGFVAMSCQTVLEVQQIPCRGASRLSDFETSVSTISHVVDILFMSRWCFLSTKVSFCFLHMGDHVGLFLSHVVVRTPTFVWQDLNSLLIRESEALREVPSDLKNDVGSCPIYMWVTFLGDIKKRELGQCTCSQMYGIYIGSRRHA